MAYVTDVFFDTVTLAEEEREKPILIPLIALVRFHELNVLQKVS